MARWVKSPFLVFLFLLSFLANSAFAEDVVLKADWLMDSHQLNNTSEIFRGVVFMEPTIYPGSASYLRNTETDTVASYCKSINEEACAKASRVMYKAYLEECTNQLIVDCIETFWVELNGRKYEATRYLYMPEKYETSFTGDPSLSLPNGRAPSIWKVDSLQAEGKPTYFSVNPVATSQLTRGTNSSFGQSPKEIEATIDQVSLETGNYSAPFFDPKTNKWTISGCLAAGCSGPQVGACAAVGNGICARRENNIPGIRYGLSLLLTRPPVNWLHGRLKEPDFLVEQEGAAQRWTVSGEPMVLPVTSVWVPDAELNKVLSEPSRNQDARSSWSGPLNSGSHAVTTFDLWSKFLGEKASALQSRWSFRTMGMGTTYNGKSIEKCSSQSSVIGLVTTNALVYQGEPPQWNPETESLDYKIASQHFAPDGSEFLGVYDLKIDEKVARCIYNIANVPIKASVSIVAPDGARKVATSTFSVKNNWLSLSVAGFTFSSPTMQVKFEKEVLPTPSPSPSETQKPTAAGKPSKSMAKVSYCKKGSTLKKLQTGKSKCPNGYQLIKK